MGYTNETAASVAREIIEARNRDAVEATARDRVAGFTALLGDCIDDGSVLTFEKTADRRGGSVTYRYAVIRSNGRWYRTGDDLSMDDDGLIVFLVGLEIEAVERLR